MMFKILFVLLVLAALVALIWAVLSKDLKGEEALRDIKKKAITTKVIGWWQLTTTVEPSKIDLEHIAELIRDGHISGEIEAT